MRVLIYTEAWGKGGIESFVSNEVRILSARGFEFEVFSTWCWSGYEGRGLEHLHVPHEVVFPGYRPNLVKRTIYGAAEFSKVLERKRYDAVHINTMNGMGFLYAAIARWHGVPVRVVHSHNSEFGTGARALKTVMHTLGKRLFMSSATCCVACSDLAGRYLFGERSYEIIPNGILTDRFVFSAEMRRRTRERFGIPLDVPLIGSVGRLAPQKNPLFQLKVFERIKEIIPRAMFLMVGSGELGEEVGAEICRLGLNDSVIRCETSNNTSEIYSALDLLLMPSLFEGLPMVAVEAQCSGLPVLCSDVISNEVKLTDLVERRPLDDSAEKWAINAKYIINNQKEDRSSYAAKIEKAGYSAADTFLRLEKVINGEEVGYR